MTVKEIKAENKQLKKENNELKMLTSKIIDILNEDIDNVSIDVHMRIISILLPYMYEMDLREYKKRGVKNG